jgi:hypothetical protein
VLRRWKTSITRARASAFGQRASVLVLRACLGSGISTRFGAEASDILDETTQQIRYFT